MDSLGRLGSLGSVVSGDIGPFPIDVKVSSPVTLDIRQHRYLVLLGELKLSPTDLVNDSLHERLGNAVDIPSWQRLAHIGVVGESSCT